MALNLEALDRSIGLSTGRFLSGGLLGLCRRALRGSLGASNFLSGWLLRASFLNGRLLRRSFLDSRLLRGNFLGSRLLRGTFLGGRLLHCRLRAGHRRA